VAHVHQPQLGREILLARREIVEIPLKIPRDPWRLLEIPLEILLEIWLGLGLG